MMALFKTAQSLRDISNIKHGFFGREGGVSSGLYRSLNCGTHSFDQAENVAKNRQLAVQALSNEAKLVEIHQTHSALVHIIEDDLSVVDCDAIVTKAKNIALSIVTADCAPVLLVDHEAGVIAAAHAGWQGAKSEIIENTIKAMCDLGAQRKDIIAAIGPCISQCSYEVNAEFYQKFEKKIFFKSSSKADHFLFDLEGYVGDKLKQSQIEQIETLSLDTYVVENNYFSYRRKTHRLENDYGRQISIIMLA